MRPNHAKASLEKGDIVIGTFVFDSRSPVVVQILANAGFDFVTFDCEHSGYNLETLSNLIIGARAANTVSFVRVPHRNFEPLLSRPLDIGAQGLIVPNVRTPEEAAFVAQAVRYPPAGNRGAAFSRIHSDFSSADAEAVIEESNRNLLAIVQIESEEGAANAATIMATPGIDAAIVGPNDLSVALGLPGQFGHAEVGKRIDMVAEACRRHGKHFGIFVNTTEDAEHYMEEGASLILYSAEVYMLAKQATTSMRALEKLRSRFS